MAEYNLNVFPFEMKHSFTRIPKLGDKVHVNINNIGKGVIDGFFIEEGYAGIQVKLNPKTEPDWHKRQCAGKWYAGHALVFGAEITFLNP